MITCISFEALSSRVDERKGKVMSPSKLFEAWVS